MTEVGVASTRSLVQFRDADGARGVALLRDGRATVVPGASSTLAMAQQALGEGVTLATLAERAGDGEPVDLAQVELLPPIDHADPAHLLLTGTGLTHLGSAEGRDRMHRAIDEAAQQTDSMKMFLMGVEGGKPPSGPGVQPEWFYKGDGASLVAPGAPLPSPAFALDAGEEPEIAGIYLIDQDGGPVRLGHALANEFSDHVTERGNYLWLAHSKLRPAALGPELLLGELPAPCRGHPAGSCATARRSGRSRSSPARPTCRTASPTWNITISNTRRSGGRATSTSTSSAPRRCRSATTCVRGRATSSRYRRRRSRWRCATRSAGKARPT